MNSKKEVLVSAIGKMGAAACLFAAAALLPLLIACGGSSTKVKANSPEAYVNALCSVYLTNFDETRAPDLVNFDPAGPNAAEEARRAALVTGEVADGLSNIDPPGEVAEIHERLINAFRDISRRWSHIEDALALPTDDPDSATAVDQALAAAKEAAGLMNSVTFPEAYGQAFADSDICQRLPQSPSTPTE